MLTVISIPSRIICVTNISSFKGETWEYFKNLANKSLGNKINITHNHSAQLYGQSEGIQALQAGAVHFISPGAPLLTGAFPKMAVFGLPLMYDPPEEIREIADSPEIGGKIFAEMIRQDKVQIISCTGANLEEDIMNLVAHSHYKRIPNYRNLTPEQEWDLLEKGLNRVTDTCIPEEEAFRRIQGNIERF